MTEKEIVQALKARNDDVFGEFVKAHQDLVFNTALAMVQSREDAEDLAQEVFIQVHNSIGSFKGDSKLSTWLYRITITKCLDHLKHKKRKRRFGVLRSIFAAADSEEVEAVNFYHPGVQLDDKERSAVLFKAISTLADNQKIAFTLHKIEGLSYAEIGEVMNCTIASVEAYMHRAKQSLRKQLFEYYNQ